MAKEYSASELLNMILNDPPDRRWKSVRALAGVSDLSIRNEVLKNLQIKLDEGISDPMVSERVKLAFRMINAAEYEPPYINSDNNEKIYSHLTSCGNDDPENTDYPMPRFLLGGERGTVLSILENDLLTEEEKKAVLGGNAARLMGE